QVLVEDVVPGAVRQVARVEREAPGAEAERDQHEGTEPDPGPGEGTRHGRNTSDISGMPVNPGGLRTHGRRGGTWPPRRQLPLSGPAGQTSVRPSGCEPIRWTRIELVVPGTPTGAPETTTTVSPLAARPWSCS